MTIKQLKEMIEGMPDDARVYYENMSDHDARELHFRDAFIVNEDGGAWLSQFHGDQYLQDNHKKVRALVTGG